jgi:predicted DNA-binding transcriptional regulator AlpA
MSIEAMLEGLIRRVVREEVRHALQDARVEDPLLRAPEAAKRAGVSERTWRRWVDEGAAPPPDLRVGGVVAWRASAVETAVAEMGRPRMGVRGRE